ncbi:hypothetical protein FOL46_007112 [Perkinsus olseni]|nr:hypothetical protein FOL46_007112 [Perkinsus olseni]
MFGRMVGRLSLVHAFYNGRRVKSPILRSGVIMSKGASTVLRDSHPSGQIDIDLAEAWILRSREEIPVGREQTHSVDRVGYREEDYAFAMYLVASTSFKLQLSNFGSYRQHFLVAEDVTRRLAARREALHQSFPPPSCVLHAWPITPDDAFDLAYKTGLSELEALCTHCDDKLTRLVGASTYSWLEEPTGEFIEEPYYSVAAKRALDLCQDAQLASVLLRQRSVQTYENGVVILAPPGQGTSWVFDNFKEGWPVDHEDAVVKADYWHPYCNEMYRHELSMVFSAAEDDTKEDLLSLDFNSHALDAVVRLLTANGTKLVVTKEVMNLFRILDLAELKGHTILLLYRRRRHTFPMSNPPCRTCFYEALRESLLIQNYSHPVLVLAQKIIRPLTPDTPETHAMLHAVLWRVLLWRVPEPRILRYEDLIAASTVEDLVRVYETAWSHDGRLRRVVDFKAVAERTMATRKSIEWLEGKEARYNSVVSAEWEELIEASLDRFKELDPTTDDSIIREGGADHVFGRNTRSVWFIHALVHGVQGGLYVVPRLGDQGFSRTKCEGRFLGNRRSAQIERSDIERLNVVAYTGLLKMLSWRQCLPNST